MSTVSSTSSSTPATKVDVTSDGTVGFTTRAPKQVLDSSDFMKLLSTQMANQDPLKPMEDTAFISQMASFSSLNQMQQMTTSFATLSRDTTNNSAGGLLGYQVTAVDSDGNSVVGRVTAVDTSGSEPVLTVNGTACKYSTVTKVEFPTSNTSTATSTTG
jgi:flagellar basal-body rod modification protein FlgD